MAKMATGAGHFFYSRNCLPIQESPGHRAPGFFVFRPYSFAQLRIIT